MAYAVRNNEEQGLGRLPTQFDQSPKIQEYLRTYLAGIDDLQTLTTDYESGIRIDNAVGAQLDIIGKIVGVARLSRNDADYRIAIKTKIILNTSQGRPRDIYAAARAVANSTKANFWEHYPASLVVSAPSEFFEVVTSDGDNLSLNGGTWGYYSSKNIPQNAREIVDNAAEAAVNVGAFLLDTDNNGLIFAEIIFEEGTIVTDDGSDLIDSDGNFIEYQLVTSSTTNTNASRFAEIPLDTLTTTGGDTFTLNGENWNVSSTNAEEGTGNIFFEVLGK